LYFFFTFLVSENLKSQQKMSTGGDSCSITGKMVFPTLSQVGYLHYRYAICDTHFNSRLS